MFAVTKRLLLRPGWSNDAPELARAIADEQIVRNLARAPWPYSKDDARSFVELPVDPMFPRFLITRSRDAALIGCIGIDMTDGQVELGYWISRPHWGQGYATEAGRGVIEVASTLGYKSLVASHFLDNPASGKVLTKLGFSPTGRVVERHSCGRGEKAPTAEFSLNLSEQSADWQSAA